MASILCRFECQRRRDRERCRERWETAHQITSEIVHWRKVGINYALFKACLKWFVGVMHMNFAVLVSFSMEYEKATQDTERERERVFEKERYIEIESRTIPRISVKVWSEDKGCQGVRAMKWNFQEYLFIGVQNSIEYIRLAYFIYTSRQRKRWTLNIHQLESHRLSLINFVCLCTEFGISKGT